MANQHLKIINRIKKRQLKLFKKVNLDIAPKIIKDSPIDTRRFVESWSSSIGVLLIVDPFEGATAGGSLNPTVRSLRIGDIFYFTNHQPYGPRLEFEGWSMQAPFGFVRINIADWQGINDRQVKTLL